MPSNYDALRAFVDEFSELTKEGANKTEPGNYDDASAHPSADVDSGTYTSSEGERAEEHDEDARKDIHVADLPGVDKSPPPTLEEAATTENTHPSFVGEDPAVEDDYETEQDDPGTSHPAEFGSTTDEKTGSLSDEELIEKMSEWANAILADIAVSAGAAPDGSASTAEIMKAAAEAAAMAAGQPVVDETTKQAEAAKFALLAGYELANRMLDEAEKTAAAETSDDLDVDAQRLAYEAMIEADEMAEKTAQALRAYIGTLQKSAMDDMMEHAEGAEEGDPTLEGTEDEEVASSPEEAADMVGDEIDVESLLDNVAEEEKENGDIDTEDALNELASAMVEMGVSPEDLVAAADESSEDKMAADRSKLRKIASAVTRYRRSGRFAFGPPKTKRAAQLRKELRKYVAELIH